MKTQEQLRRGGGQGRQEAGASAPGVRAASYDRFPSSSGYAGGSAEDAQPRVMRGERDASPGRTPASPSYADHGSPGLVSSTYSLSLEGAGFARTRVGGLTTSSSTPTVTVSTPTSARFPQRVLSVDVLRAPRPLSERALIPLGPRAGRRGRTDRRTLLGRGAGNVDQVILVLRLRVLEYLSQRLEPTLTLTAEAGPWLTGLLAHVAICHPRTPWPHASPVMDGSEPGPSTGLPR